MQAANTQARRERKTMAIAATETTSLIAFTLPSTPYSVQMARFYVRAALSYHDLGDYAEDAETVTSELVTNAITHAGAPAVGLELTCLEGAGALAIVVTDPCPLPPVKRDPADGRRARARPAPRGSTVRPLGMAAARPRQSRVRDPHQGGHDPMEAISDLPMLHDMDADYSPQYVKLARILRDKIESGDYKHGDPLPAASLASEYGVSVRVAWHALAMLAANSYVRRPGTFASYRVTWQAGR